MNTNEVIETIEATKDSAILDAAKEIASQGTSISNDIEKLHPENLKKVFELISPVLIKLAYQLITIFLIIFISKKIITFLSKLLSDFFKKSKLDIGIRKFFISFFKFICYTIVFFIISSRIGINSASFVAVLGSAGIAIGLALQGSLANFAGGIIILLMKPFSVDDYIQTSVGEGWVKMIGLVYTTITTYDNKQITIPNGNLSNGIITNITAKDIRMLEIKMDVAYSTNLDLVKEVLKSVYLEEENIINKDEIVCFVDSFKDSSILIGIRGFVLTENFVKTKWKINENIKKAFDKNKISIPFNQLEVKLL